MTLEEAWSRVKLSVDYFRVFGCVGYVHIPDAKRTKLGDKSVSCVKFGVSGESKGYRMFDMIFKRIIISRDIIFEEDHMWNWNAIFEGEKLMESEWGDNIEEDNIAQEREVIVADITSPTENNHQMLHQTWQ